ncbi:MAG: hypothetical protein ACK5LS_02715 [Propioniciclava sp.]
MTTYILTQGAVNAARAEVGDQVEVHLIEDSAAGLRWEVTDLPGCLSPAEPTGRRPEASAGSFLRIIGFDAHADGSGELVLSLHRDDQPPLRTVRWRVEVRRRRRPVTQS